MYVMVLSPLTTAVPCAGVSRSGDRERVAVGVGVVREHGDGDGQCLRGVLAESSTATGASFNGETVTFILAVFVNAVPSQAR